jgi:hypothetical protein
MHFISLTLKIRKGDDQPIPFLAKPHWGMKTNLTAQLQQEQSHHCKLLHGVHLASAYRNKTFKKCKLVSMAGTGVLFLSGGVLLHL